MDFSDYLRLFRKWLWLIVIVALVTGALGYVVRTRQQPVYQATAKLLIGGVLRSSNLTPSEFDTSVELAQTYAELARSFTLLQAALDGGAFPLSAEELSLSMGVSVRTDTPILEISVRHSDPLVAAALANGLAEQLIAASPTERSLEELARMEFLRDEIDYLTALSLQFRERISAIDQQLASPLLNIDIDLLTQERLSLSQQSIEITAAISQLTETIRLLDAHPNSLDLIDPAHVPAAPSGVSPLIITVLGALIGALATTGAIFQLNEFNHTLRTPAQVTHQLDLPLLSTVSRIRGGEPALIAHQQPHGRAAERYRLLLTSLSGTGAGRPRHIIVTSARVGEGVTTTAANLAATIAASGTPVLLVDASLNNPHLHRVFGVKNERGLINLLVSTPADEAEASALLDTALHTTAVPNLRLLTAGTLDNVAQAANAPLRLPHFVDWAQLAESRLGVRAVVFDTTPCLESGTSLVLAESLNATVVVVVEAARTRYETVQSALRQFTQIGHTVGGIVLNKA